MADRGFTIKDMLKELNIDLNIPPFLEGRHQLPAAEVEQGRKIASLQIHVERAIGRLKTFSILKQTISISMARLLNQIVFVHFCQIFTLHWFLLHNNVKKVMFSIALNNSLIVIHPQKTDTST